MGANAARFHRRADAAAHLRDLAGGGLQRACRRARKTEGRTTSGLVLSAFAVAAPQQHWRQQRELPCLAPLLRPRAPRHVCSPAPPGWAPRRPAIAFSAATREHAAIQRAVDAATTERSSDAVKFSIPVLSPMQVGGHQQHRGKGPTPFRRQRLDCCNRGLIASEIELDGKRWFDTARILQRFVLYTPLLASRPCARCKARKHGAHASQPRLRVRPNPHDVQRCVHRSASPRKC